MNFTTEAKSLLLQMIREEGGEKTFQVHRDLVGALGYLEELAGEGRIKLLGEDSRGKTYRLLPRGQNPARDGVRSAAVFFANPVHRRRR